MLRRRTIATRLNALAIAPRRARHRASPTYRIHISIHIRSTTMNWDRIEGNWKQVKGSVKEKWGKLTDDQLDVIAGKRDILAGRIQETYGLTKEAAEQQLAEWQEKQRDLDELIASSNKVN
jgi:uncharacterized protein YjbJ (UPF0337 family)